MGKRKSKRKLSPRKCVCSKFYWFSDKTCQRVGIFIVNFDVNTQFCWIHRFFFFCSAFFRSCTLYEIVVALHYIFNVFNAVENENRRNWNTFPSKIINIRKHNIFGSKRRMAIIKNLRQWIAQCFHNLVVSMVFDRAFHEEYNSPYFARIYSVLLYLFVEIS